jgi:hypothetical protein
MNRAEAELVAEDIAGRYRVNPREELLRLIDKQESFEVAAPSGNRYQLEVTAVWDDRERNNLRVFVAVDDGGFFSAISPLTVDFIVAPDGTFVGES